MSISSSPLISVIVPIYGIEKYLTKCIESIISQTYKNLEIILVNDGSPDNSAKICDKYTKIDERIKVIHKENGGLVSARKAGLLASTGEYIAYVDGDDWIEPKMYQSLMSLILKYNTDVVIAGHKVELENSAIDIMKNTLPCGLYKAKDLQTKLYPKMLNTGLFSQFGIYSYLWNKLFKKSVIYDAQMCIDNDIFMGEDAACLYPALLNAKSIYITDSTHYHYIQHTNSMVKTRKLDASELSRYNQLFSHLYNQFDKYDHKLLLKPQLKYYMLSLITVRASIYNSMFSNPNELFAYGEIEKGSKIIIYGAGTYGQHLYSRVKNSAEFDIVDWVDIFYEKYRNIGLDVNPIDSVLNKKYDYIVVAYISEKTASIFKDMLIEKGIESNKISTVNHYKNYSIKELLQKYGLELQ